MSRIVIELTNRCNLKCHHCFTGRHGGNDDLPLEILAHILAEARGLGVDLLSYTGGDPTVYRYFKEALTMTAAAGYDFGLNTNGRNFDQIYPLLLQVRERLKIITFSLDGATEETHDRLRGKNSFRRALKGMSICMAEKIPFSINMVVTAHNRHELGRMVELATRLGARGVRFGHLMPAPLTTAMDFDLTPRERKVVEAEIWHLRRQAALPVAMAPGYHTTDLFPCAPLNLEEFNINCHGEVTKCCHLSGHGEHVGTEDIIGHLQEISLSKAYELLANENKTMRQAKLARLQRDGFDDTDYFACWYCSLYYDKVNWLKNIEGHPWAQHIKLPIDLHVAEPSIVGSEPPG